MKLYKRTEYSNIYEIGGGKFQASLGGVPNILSKGNLVPMENNLVDTGEPGCVWKPKRAPGNVKFQNRGTNKYLTQVETDAGEKISVTMPAMPSATPIIQPDGITIKWTFPNGNTVTKAVTEKGVKETVFQKAGEIVKFKYATDGLDVVKKTGCLEFNSKATGKVVFKTETPYDMATGQTVPVTINKTGNTWSITYPTHATDREIDPTIIFGIGAGVEAGLGHKDTYVYSAGVAVGQGNSVILSLRLAVRVPLIRFDLSLIPNNAVLNSAVLTPTTNVNGVGGNVSIHRLITSWGITDFDAGVLINPAINGEATWRRSRDFNGAGGDVAWAVGITFSAADFIILADDTQVLAGVAAQNNFNVLATAQSFVNGSVVNNGWMFNSTINNNDSYHSLDAVIPAVRPFLTVDYTVPSDDAVRRVLKSHMGLTQNAMSL